jgi:hypothetical protein
MAKPQYNWRHQKIRKAMLPAAYGEPCHFCGLPMFPGQLLDLDHLPGSDSYRGMAHRHCNRRDGARRGNALRGLRRRLSGSNRCDCWRYSTIVPPSESHQCNYQRRGNR